MDDTIQFLLSFGAILLLGLATDAVGRRTSLPRVSLLILLGLLTGPQLLQLIPYTVVAQFELITNLALLMIGFLLGGRLTRGSLRKLTTVVLSISGLAALVTAIFVAGMLTFIGIPVEIAILMGCIASATDPSATYDVVNEEPRGGRCADVLLAIVAIDDVWAFVIFSLGLSLVSALTLQDASMLTHLHQIAHDLGGLQLSVSRLAYPQPILPVAYGRGSRCWLRPSH